MHCPAGTLLLVLPLLLAGSGNGQDITSAASSAPAWATSGGVYDGQMTFGWSSGSYQNLAPDAWTSTPTILSEATSVTSSPAADASSASAVVTATAVPNEGPRTAVYAGSWTKFDTVVVAHAVVGSLAWMILSPILILLSRYTDPSSALTWSISAFTFLLTIAAVALGGVATNLAGVEHFATAHQRLGISLLILLILQCILALWAERQRRRSSPKASALFQKMLIFGSTVLTAIGFAQVYLGVSQYALRSGRSIPSAVIIIWAIIVGLFSVYLILLAVRYVWLSKSPSSTRTDSITQSWQHIASPHSSIRDHHSLASHSASSLPPESAIGAEMEEIPQRQTTRQREELPLHQSLGFLPLTHSAPLHTIDEERATERRSDADEAASQSSRQEQASVIPVTSSRRGSGVKRKAVPSYL